MSTLRLDTLEMPAGGMGVPDPLPQLGHRRGPHGEQAGLHEAFDEEQARLVHYGHVPGCLPYRKVFGYDRDLKPHTFRTAVLENDILRATFMLELGGRLWSLVHKPTGRELLYVNHVFQPANLGTVNIWFSGGVEWNCGIRGHTPLTCSPMWAARVTGENGEPILRLYEFERIRCLPYQMDFSLPDGSPWLLARMRLTNPHDAETPMYWWSNIAVPELDGARVVMPAHRSIRFNYNGDISHRYIPIHEGHNVTYPASPSVAGDFFYELDEADRPWIASLERDGAGLAQMSTPLLKGRKLFRWGQGRGGRHWQEFLSPGGPPYIEIQAGLALTQAQSLPMPPGCEWTWLEAYGLMQADPAIVHGDDWDAAVGAVHDGLDAGFTAEQLEAKRSELAGDADRAPDEILHRGSGWGTLERLRRERDGEQALCSDALVFDDAAMNGEQAPWQTLLDDGALPEGDPDDEPADWMIQPEWREQLTRAMENGCDHWSAWLHRGVMDYYHDDHDDAEAAWKISLERKPSAWAYRNLARLALGREQHGKAADLILKARAMLPDLAPLAIECGRILIRAGRPQELLALFETLPESVQKVSRLRVLEARAALDAGELDVAESIVTVPMVVTDIREGEVSLTEIWFELHEQRVAEREGVPIDDALKKRVREEFPPPQHLEFRMHK
jgi:uncharacterized protein DUF5107